MIKAQRDLQRSLPTFEKLEAAIDGLLKLILSYVDKNRSELTNLIDNISAFSVASIVALLAFMCAVTWLLTNLICRPQLQVVTQADAVTEGNFAHHLIAKPSVTTD